LTDIVTGMARYRDPPGLNGMFVLPVASLRRDQVLPILLKQSDHV
jgi:hypothetical protein